MTLSEYLICAVIIIVSVLLGFILGKVVKKPLGEIIFSPAEEDGEERIKCIFKLDMEIEDMLKQKYILFKVVRSQK